MNVDDWQKRLEENFSTNGIVGSSLLRVVEQEKNYGDYFVKTYHGHSILSSSFQGFYIETIEKTLEWIASCGWPKKADNYPPTLLYYVVMFRRFRASENLLLRGYPLDGYALLRDLKDRAILMGGIAQNITTLLSVFGYEGLKTLTERNAKDLQKNRRKEEHRVLKRMIRCESDLPIETIQELEKWEVLFHEEVHGSKFSFFFELDELMKSTTPLTVGPKPIVSAIAMYMNRAVEIAWLLERLLPYLQPAENSFGSEWHTKHKILDDSFRYAEESLGDLGKKIGDAFIVFVDKKFSFKQPFFYFEANGKG